MNKNEFRPVAANGDNQEMFHDIPEGGGGEVTKEAIAEAGGLVTPDEAPAAPELVGIGTDGKQTPVEVGEGLEVVDGILKSKEIQIITDSTKQIGELGLGLKFFDVSSGPSDFIGFVFIKDAGGSISIYGIGNNYRGKALRLHGSHITTTTTLGTLINTDNVLIELQQVTE